jgi:hypothetical protein
VLSTVLSAVLSDGVDPTSLAGPLLEKGTLGIALVAVTSLLLVFLRREWKARDQDQATIAAQQKFIQEQAIPALVRATDAGGRMTELADQNIEALGKVAELLRELRELRERRPK